MSILSLHTEPSYFLTDQSKSNQFPSIDWYDASNILTDNNAFKVSYQDVKTKTMSSANCRLLMRSSYTETLVPLSWIFPLITLSKYVMNVFGEIGSPCLVPPVVRNQSPVSLPILTGDFDLYPMFCEIPISLSPTPYDFSVAQLTSCLMESNVLEIHSCSLFFRLGFWQSVSTSGF